MRRALWVSSPVAEARGAISRPAIPRPAFSAQATVGSRAPAPPRTTTLTRRGSSRSGTPSRLASVTPAPSSTNRASSTTNVPTTEACGVRCQRVRLARRAASSGAFPGGKIAASSTSSRRYSGVLDTDPTLTHRGTERTPASDKRTRRNLAMTYYRQVGDVPRRRHTAFRDDAGALRYEEVMGEEGFSSDSSLLYHRGVPSAVVDSQTWDLPDLATTPNHPLKPRHLKLHDLPAGGDPVTGRRLVMGNGDVRISYVVSDTTSPYYRNAVGDEFVYVESGSGSVETIFGSLDYRTGDYVLVPRATPPRGVPAEESRLYAIEANSHIAPPKRYLSRYGQFLEHAPYCERDLHGPGEPHVVEGTDVEVLVKHRVSSAPGGVGGSRLTYATHPFDVVGWDGCLYPHTFNV